MSMLIRQSWKRNVVHWWKDTAALEFFFRLTENPIYPFEDLGNGYFRLLYVNTSSWVGIWFWFLAAFFIAASFLFIGFTGMILVTCFVLFILGFKRMYLKFGAKELIFCKTFGFVIRPRWNETVVVEQNIHNIYIRLEKVIDQNRVWNYCLVIGGCRLENIRLTRFQERDHNQLRCLGRLYARTMNLNYFDFDDVSPAHRVRHFRNTSPWEHLEEIDVVKILEDIRVRQGDRLTKHLRMWLTNADSMIQRITKQQEEEDAEDLYNQKYTKEETDVREILWDEYVKELMSRYAKIREEMKEEDLAAAHASMGHHR